MCEELIVKIDSTVNMIERGTCIHTNCNMCVINLFCGCGKLNRDDNKCNQYMIRLLNKFKDVAIDDLNELTKTGKVIRKISDLHGLSNGFGAVIEVDSSDFIDVMFKTEDGFRVNMLGMKTSELTHEQLKTVYSKLKSLGFKFTTKRTVEEVLSDYTRLEFVKFKQNWTVYLDSYDDKYKKMSKSYDILIGTTYFSEEDCEKIVAELNG